MLHQSVVDQENLYLFELEKLKLKALKEKEKIFINDTRINLSRMK